MNVETGEVREIGQQEQVGVGEVGIKIGDIIKVNGVALKLAAVNTGKRRLTFVTMPRNRAGEELKRAELAVVKQVEQHKAAKGDGR